MCQDHVGSANGMGPDLPTRCQTRCRQRPGTLPYSLRVAPWGLDDWACLSMFGEVTDHSVSGGPAHVSFSNLFAEPSIKTCVQLLSFLPDLVVECLVHGQLFLRRSLAGFLGGLSSLGLGCHRFHWMDWVFS